MINKEQKLCINCKFYKAGKDEDDDICTHEKAVKYAGGVRAFRVEYFACAIMTASGCNCSQNKLFEPKELSTLVNEATNETS